MKWMQWVIFWIWLTLTLAGVWAAAYYFGMAGMEIYSLAYIILAALEMLVLRRRRRRYGSR